MKDGRPEPLFINGGLVSIADLPEEAGFKGSYVDMDNVGSGLSPYEAEELRDWLSNFLEWYYNKRKENESTA